MASYTPQQLGGPTGIAATAGTEFFKGTTGSKYGIRTTHAESATGSHTLTMSIGADAAGTRLFDGLVVTNNVPQVWNEWQWINSALGAHDIDANTSARDMALAVGGYLFA
jgi:hypothetical protein